MADQLGALEDAIPPKAAKMWAALRIIKWRVHRDRDGRDRYDVGPTTALRNRGYGIVRSCTDLRQHEESY